MRKISAIILLIIFLPDLNSGQSNNIYEWQKFSNTKDSVKLINFIVNKASSILNKTPMANNSLSDITIPPFYGKLGLFITIIKSGKVRGCYGSFSHRTDSLEKVLNEYLLGALKSDPRHKPIEADELDSSEIILTVADQPAPVNDLDNADLKKKGVVISLDSGEKFVFVPAEIKTSAYIRREFSGRDYQVEVFNSVTIRSPR